jgi:NADP-dependent alcohol dehydrogenase
MLFGKGQIPALDQLVPQNARIMVTFGGGSVKKNGVLQQVRDALGKRIAVEFGGIEPNPPYETLIEAIALARRENIDFILAVGGGSVIDGSKFIAAGLCFDGDPWEIIKARGRNVTGAIKLGSVLTLPATGSEMNNGGVISRKSTGEKLEFSSPHVLPQFSILDPTISFSLPAKQTANGVVDAFVHVAEQYLTYPVNAKVQDRLAEGLMLTLIEEGPKALQHPQDYDVRANIMWAATMALNDLIALGVPQDWATHNIGHELTATHGIDHGQTLAIVLPSLLQETRGLKREKLLQFAHRVWGLEGQDEEQLIDAAIAATRDFFERMGLPTHLSDYGVDGSTIPDMVKRLHAHGVNALGERPDVELPIARILGNAR